MFAVRPGAGLTAHGVAIIAPPFVLPFGSSAPLQAVRKQASSPSADGTAAEDHACSLPHRRCTRRAAWNRLPPRKQRHRRSGWRFNPLRRRLSVQRSFDGKQTARRSSSCPVTRFAVFPFPPFPRRGVCAVRSASPRFSLGPERLRWPFTGMPCANSLRLGFASGGRCAHALRASHWCSLPPPDHSVQGGSGRGTQAKIAAFMFPHPPPHPSFVKRLPVAGSRRVLAPVMPPAM